MPKARPLEEGLGRSFKVDAWEKWHNERCNEERRTNLDSEEATKHIGRDSKKCEPDCICLGLERR